jgi:hypothetical protein
MAAHTGPIENQARRLTPRAGRAGRLILPDDCFLSRNSVPGLAPSPSSQWTLFDLPNRGTESRHISLLEREGQAMQVIVPYYRTRKVAVITPRTEAEIEALRKQAGQ